MRCWNLPRRIARVTFLPNKSLQRLPTTRPLSTLPLSQPFQWSSSFSATTTRTPDHPLPISILIQTTFPSPLQRDGFLRCVFVRWQANRVQLGSELDTI